MDIFDAAAQTDVPIPEVEWMNSNEVGELLRKMNLDLEISLGCGSTRARAFMRQRFGMIIYHGELLPEYPGAQGML